MPVAAQWYSSAARMPSDPLSVLRCIRWLSNRSGVGGVQEHGHSARHVVVDDLAVAVVRARAEGVDALVHRLPV